MTDREIFEGLRAIESIMALYNDYQRLQEENYQLRRKVKSLEEFQEKMHKGAQREPFLEYLAKQD